VCACVCVCVRARAAVCLKKTDFHKTLCSLYIMLLETIPKL